MAFRNQHDEFDYASVEFYNPRNPFGARRAASRARDFGAHWRNVESPGGAQFTVRWFADSGELIAQAAEHVFLLGVIKDESLLETYLSGWPRICPDPPGQWPSNSLQWVRDRLTPSVYHHTILCEWRRVARSFWFKACLDWRSLCVVHVNPEPHDEFGHECEQLLPDDSPERWVIRLPDQFAPFLEAVEVLCRLGENQGTDVVSVTTHDQAFTFVLYQESPGHISVSLRDPDLEIARLELWELRALLPALLALAVESRLLLGDANPVSTPTTVSLDS
jgi:hypothetical protein